MPVDGDVGFELLGGDVGFELLDGDVGFELHARVIAKTLKKPPATVTPINDVTLADAGYAELPVGMP